MTIDCHMKNTFRTQPYIGKNKKEIENQTTHQNQDKNHGHDGTTHDMKPTKYNSS